MKNIALLILMIWSGTAISQEKLEIDGKVRITAMDVSDSDSIVVWSSDGILANRNASTLPVAGTMVGEMLYWNGTAWITVSAGTSGQVLSMENGVPKWSTINGAGVIGSTDVYNPATGKIWMDRNLGATQVATSGTDTASYGYLYQWGRGTDGHQLRTSDTTSTLSLTDTPVHDKFIKAPNSPYDWRSGQNNNLWQGISGVNNPCPSGYRIPTEAEWEAERASWSANNSTGAFASPLKLPMAGFRFSWDGLLLEEGSNGTYWSSTVSGTNSRLVLFNSVNTQMIADHRAYGFSVRCIKD